MASLSESTTLRGCLLAASRMGWRLFRNNCGVDITRGVRYGIANPGGADLIGWQTVTITPDMVGQRVAVFTAVECKSPKGKTSPEQDNFLRQVTAAGGVAILAKSPDDLLTDK